MRFSLIAKLLFSSFYTIPVFVTVFGAVGISFLLFDNFKTEYVLPVGGILGLLMVMWLTKTLHKDGDPGQGSNKERRIVDTVVILGVLLWVGINGLFTSQHVFTNRDPATYAVAGAWLTKHDSIRIDKPEAFVSLESQKVVSTLSAGIEQSEHNKNQLYAQGTHILPAYLGIAGRFVGESIMLHLNVIFGGIALLAMYGFARLVVKPRWALLATGIVAGSLPLIYFSRDTYTEPLALIFTFGALALLYIALQAKQQSLPLWATAGLVAGAGIMSRIDAYITLIALCASFIIILALTERRQRLQRIKAVAIFMVACATTSIIGFLDVALLSSGYFVDTDHLIYPQIYVIFALILLGAIVVPLIWRYKAILPWLDEKTKTWRAKAAFWGLLVIAGIMASRPLWMAVYTPSQNGLVAGLQAAAGVKIEPRSYAEQTINWIAWYIGPIITIASAFGIAVVGRWLVTSKRYLPLLPFFLVILATCALYLTKPSITPDHIWAARRLLPVILPGVAILGCIALSELLSRKASSRVFLGAQPQVVVTMLATLAFVAPLVITLPFTTLREDAQLARIRSVCNALPDKAAVIWLATARLQAPQTTRTFCDVPAAGFLDDESLHDKSLMRRVYKEITSRGYEPIVGIYAGESGVIPEEDRQHMKVAFDGHTKRMVATLLKPPHKTKVVHSQVLMGRIGSDGSIKAVDQYDK